MDIIINQIFLIAAISITGMECDNFHTREAFHKGIQSTIQPWWRFLIPINAESKSRIVSLTNIENKQYWKQISDDWWERNRNNLLLPWMPDNQQQIDMNHPDLVDFLPFDEEPVIYPKYRIATAIYIRNLIIINQNTDFIEPLLDEYEEKAIRFMKFTFPHKNATFGKAK